MRMCPSCPDCVNSDNPCQDALGSVAELLGGCVGRADALIGAVECQKSNGSLHFHWFMFIQRVHKYSTMQEIAALLEEAIIESGIETNIGESLCLNVFGFIQALFQTRTAGEEFPNVFRRHRMRWGAGVGRREVGTHSCLPI